MHKNQINIYFFEFLAVILIYISLNFHFHLPIIGFDLRIAILAKIIFSGYAFYLITLFFIKTLVILTKKNRFTI